jgi:putative acetyltransferase
MSIRRVVEATPEVYDLIGELNDVLGAANEAHQCHGLPTEQLFQPNVRFFLMRLDGPAVGCGGVAIFDEYAEVKRMHTRPAARRRAVGQDSLRKHREPRQREPRSSIVVGCGFCFVSIWRNYGWLLFC